MRNRPVGGVRRESRAAPLEGIKQLQRASLSSEALCNRAESRLVLAVPMYLAVWSAAPPGVRYSVLDGVEKLAEAPVVSRDSPTAEAKVINLMNHSVRWIIRLVGR